MPQDDGYEPLALATGRGPVDVRYYRVAGARSGAIFVGGVGGGWDTPALGCLYPSLARALAEDQRIAALRVRYRHPTVLEEAAFDVRAGVTFLEREGIDQVALVGHSFGGAVVLRAATASDVVATVVALSTQSYGAHAVRTLPPGCSLLLAHGTEDEVLPPRCSEWVYALAHEPKRLVLLEGATHGLDEAAEDVRRLVRDWIVEELG